jgi:sensor histidine kinase regulating citrate/malate metabolism
LLLGFSNSSTYVNKIPYSFYFFPICILTSLVAFWNIGAHERLSNENQMILSAISILLLGATAFLFITYRHNIERDNEYIRVKSEFDRLQTEKAYYDILEHQNQQLMIYAHDAKNHLAAIKSLSSNPEINSYTEKLLNQLGSYTKSCHSGNMILDVIINKYVTECEMCQIKFDYDIKSCNLAKVEDIDLVSVLGNLLDNAVAAAGKSTEKYVSLETTTRNSYDVVVISNSCDFAPEQKGAQLVTTKEDKKLHGFGIKSVKKTLKKYQGDFNWDYDIERQLFITTVMIGSVV